MGRKKEITKAKIPILPSYFGYFFTLIPSFLTEKGRLNYLSSKSSLTALSIRWDIFWHHNNQVYC